jgi:hypothetical protein
VGLLLRTLEVSDDEITWGSVSLHLGAPTLPAALPTGVCPCGPAGGADVFAGPRSGRNWGAGAGLPMGDDMSGMVGAGPRRCCWH